MHLRSIFLVLATLAHGLPAGGMSSRQAITVRFHTETNARDGDSFAMPVKLVYQRRMAYLGRVPAFSEHQIVAIYPFPAGDGSWGCMFKLNSQGRIRLETLSGETRGGALVVFVGTKSGQHQVIDMIIDRPVNDGVIAVPRGLTELEIVALRHEFKVVGGEMKDKPAEKKYNVTDSRINRSRSEQYNKPASVPAPPSIPASKRRSSPEPDLPRLAD